MQKSPTYVFINSVLAFVSAFILTTIIHESGHYLSHSFFGADPTLYHNYVQTAAAGMSTVAIVLSALAGPLISFMQGVFFSGILFRRKNNSEYDLLFLWLSLLGFINFFGYLMLTPLSTSGDTGKAAELLQLPYTLQIAIAVFGLAAIIVIVLRVGKAFARFIPRGLELSTRRKYVNALLLFPILMGSIVNVLLAFPVVSVLSIIYPATSAYVILSAYGKILNAEALHSDDSFIYLRIPIFLIGLTITSVLLNRLLTQGLF